jgi:hypothetical protein
LPAQVTVPGTKACRARRLSLRDRAPPRLRTWRSHRHRFSMSGWQKAGYHLSPRRSSRVVKRSENLTPCAKRRTDPLIVTAVITNCLPPVPHIRPVAATEQKAQRYPPAPIVPAQPRRPRRQDARARQSVSDIRGTRHDPPPPRTQSSNQCGVHADSVVRRRQFLLRLAGQAARAAAT